MTMMVIMVVMMNMIMIVMPMVWKRQKLKYSSESGLCLPGMLLFWEHKVVLHLRQTHTHKVEGMQRWVCQAISALAAISIPPLLPHIGPNFLNPLNWGGHLIGTGMWQLCQPCSNVNNQEHLHTPSAFGTSSAPQSLFSFATLESILMLDLEAEYQFAWFSSLRFLWFSVTCWLRFHRTPPPSFVIGQQLFPASSSGKLARTACQTSSKNSVGKIENKFTPSLVGDAGVTTKANDDIMEARKQNCDASTTVWWSILSRAKLVFFDICLDYHRLKITLKRIIWKPGSPC